MFSARTVNETSVDCCLEERKTVKWETFHFPPLPDDAVCLSEIQSLRVIATLEEFLRRLQILGHGIILKISVELDSSHMQERIHLIKLMRECLVVSKEIAKLCYELEFRGSFTCLHEYSEKREAKLDLKRRKQAVMAKQQEVHDKTQQLKKMIILWKQLTVKAGMKETVLSERRKVLNFIPEDRTLIDAEELLQEQLERLKKQLIEEERAHQESQKFLTKQNQELQEALDKQRQLTESILADRKQRLYKLCSKRTLGLDQLMERKLKFNEMEQLIYEDQLREEKKKKDLLLIAKATKLQAWWRGCMVRHFLGPYKKTEEKKKKDKKGKDDKKGGKKKK